MNIKTLLTGFGLILYASSPAFAHWGDIGHQHGFWMGAAHPLTGLDHLIGMLAIGLWAGFVGGAARWVWPSTFVVMAGLSAIIGHAGYIFPGLEPLIACSLIVLGAVVFLRLRLPLVAGMVLSAGAACVHGYAHGLEMSDSYGMTGYLLGFLLTTAALHGMGIVLSLRLNRTTIRIAGGLIALCGTYIFWMAV